MKILILLVLVHVLVFSSEVDTKLYEGQNREVYYKEIEKQINTAQSSNLKSQELIREERLYLSRLRSASTQDIQIEQYELAKLSKKPLMFDIYYNAINTLAVQRNKQIQSSEILNSIASKVKYSKKSILKITEEEKNKLLSYQLQYAYYKLQEKNIEKKVELYKVQDREILTHLNNNIENIVCSSKEELEKKIDEVNKEIEKNDSQKISVQIGLEKALIEDSRYIEELNKIINSTEILYQAAMKKKIILQIEQSLCILKTKDNTAFFKAIEEIQVTMQNLSKESLKIHSEELVILREISKAIFGSAELFLGSTTYEIKEVLFEVKKFFTAQIFVFNEQPISLLSIFSAILFIFIGFFLGKLYKRWITKISNRWPDMSQMSVRLASNIGYYLIVFITFVIAIGSLGIDMSSLSLIAGALSIGIGFGLQTVVSNLIAGIILMFERTIRIGDTIELSDTLLGRVTDMRIRSTTIQTFDNIDIVIPNSSFIQSNVINWTLEDISRRIHVPFGVAYGTEVSQVKEVVLDAVKNSSIAHIKNHPDKKSEIRMVSMNSSSVDFELLVWIEMHNIKSRPVSIKSDFLIIIYNALKENGIQIPFPQLDVHVKNMPNSN